MAETEVKNNFIEGFLIWSFISGIFIISLSIAITTTNKVQAYTGYTRGYSIILGAIIGIFLTVITALLLERKSR